MGKLMYFNGYSLKYYILVRSSSQILEQFWEICNFPRPAWRPLDFDRFDCKGIAPALRSSARSSSTSLRLVLQRRGNDYLTDSLWGPFQLKNVSKLSNVYKMKTPKYLNLGLSNLPLSKFSCVHV